VAKAGLWADTDAEERKRGEQEAEMWKVREQAEKEAARERRLMAVKEEQEEKADVVKTQREMINRMANSDEDPNKIAQQTRKIILKKSSARRRNEESVEVGAGEGLTIRGLKKKLAPVVEKPYDPFGGLNMAPSRYVLQPDYPNDYLKHAKRDYGHTVGGYSFVEYSSRAMFEAFSGLAVFIEDEVTEREKLAAPSPAPALAAVIASAIKLKFKVKKESDDDF